MKRGERYRITRAIGKRVAEAHQDFREVDACLNVFGVNASHSWDKFGDGVASYVAGTLSDTDDETIIEMAHEFGVSAGLTGPPDIWSNKLMFRLFISHISRDKDKATRLRDCLKTYGISGFVAHEDIRPTARWQDEIQCALNSMDAFLSMHTVGFSQSEWTQQEIGYAVARGVKIICLEMGELPTGFLQRDQALPRRSRNAQQIALEVNQLLFADPRTNQQMSEAIPF